MGEKINLRILKLSILAIPFFLLMALTLVTSPIQSFLHMVLPVDFTFGVISSILSGGMYVASMMFSTYIAIYCWQKYVPKKEQI